MDHTIKGTKALMLVSALLLQGLLVSTAPIGAAPIDDEDRLPSSYLTLFHDNFESGVIDPMKWLHWDGFWSTDNIEKTPTGGLFTGDNFYLTESPYGNEFGDPFDDNGNEGVYYPEESTMIETTWIDLRNITSPRLEFDQMYDIPSRGDGAMVYVLSDTVQEWVLLEPDTPYPESTGWSGNLQTWVTVVIRLEEYEGDRIRFGFNFKSSPDSIEGDGWQIDDVVVGGKPENMLPDLKFGNARIYLGGYPVTSAVAGDVLELNMSMINEGRAHTGPFIVAAYTDHPLRGGIEIGRHLVMEGLGVGVSTFLSMRWIAVAGHYRLHLTLDELNHIGEENELNNERKLNLDVDEPSAGDVILKDMHFETDGIPIIGAGVGDLINITATLANVGTSIVSTPMVVRAYIGFPTPDSEPIGDEQPLFSGIDAGGERNVIIHWRPLVGNHTIFLRVSPQDPGEILDFNSENNITWANLQVTNEPSVDLVAEEMHFIVNGQDTTIASEGANVHIVAMVANDGVAPYEGILRIGIFRGDPDAGGVEFGQEQVVVSLDPGTTAQIEFDWRAELGTHAMTLFVDPANVVYESNEDNNQLGKGLTVTRKPLPDLSISAMAMLLNGVPLDPTVGTNEGANVEVNVTVRNTGNERTKAETVTELYWGNPLLGGTSLGTFTVPEGLNPDEVYIASIFWAAERPPQKSLVPVLFVVADSRFTEAEVDEFNNVDMRMLPVGESLPDLTLTDLRITDDSGVPVDSMTFGASVVIEVSVTNVGTDISFIVAGVELYLDDTDPSNLIASISTSTLDIDETVTRSISWTPDPERVEGGVHTIFALVDPSNEIEESSDANNALTGSIHVDADAKPNLLVMAIEVTQKDKVIDHVDEGDVAQVRFRVANLGDAPLYRPATIELFYGDPVKGGETVGAWQLTTLETMATESFESTIEFERDVPVVVIIDRTKMVHETNEEDNIGSIHIKVVPPEEGADYIQIGLIVGLAVGVFLVLTIIIRRRPAAPELIEDLPPETAPEEEGGVVEGEDATVEEESVPEDGATEGEEEPAADKAAPEGEDEPPVEEEGPEAVPAPKCPSCGEEVDPDWILCPFCDFTLK
jgi:subtilase family serine protease